MGTKEKYDKMLQTIRKETLDQADGTLNSKATYKIILKNFFEYVNEEVLDEGNTVPVWSFGKFGTKTTKAHSRKIGDKVQYVPKQKALKFIPFKKSKRKEKAT